MVETITLPSFPSSPTLPSETGSSTGTLECGSLGTLSVTVESPDELSQQLLEIISEVSSQEADSSLVNLILSELSTQYPHLFSLNQEISTLLKQLSSSTQANSHPTQPGIPPEARAERRDLSLALKAQAMIHTAAREYPIIPPLPHIPKNETPAPTPTAQKKEPTPPLAKGVAHTQYSSTFTPPQTTARYPSKDQEKGGGQNKESDQDEGQNKKEKKKLFPVQKVKASRASAPPSSSSSSPPNTRQEATPAIDNIFIRFMALMARILGQAEAEAHELYLRIKERTDNVDLLNRVLSKINATKVGTADWSQDKEMQELLKKAKELGVEFSKENWKFTEEEKKLLKENVQMKKESMEKMTQLERTDMQRFLQEASQAHQARSNVLKLLKEVIDTFIHNIRPN